MEETIKQYKDGFITLRQVIYKFKNYKYLNDELIKCTSFLDSYRDYISVEERLYYVINNISSPVICPYCKNIKTFTGRIYDGYRNTCSSKECKSTKLSNSHTGNNTIILNRIKKLNEWQKNIDNTIELNDSVIKSNIKYSSLSKYITNKYLVKYLKSRYEDSFSIEETIDRINKNIEKKPICPTCGKPVVYIGKPSKMFTKYCCNSCAANSEEVINKKALSDIEKHDGIRGWTISNSSKEKIENRKATMISRYGTLSISKIPGMMSKIKSTCIERFGYDTPMKNSEIRKKKNTTEKNNKHSKISKYEKHFYEVLISEFGVSNVITQYMDFRYPYKCDYYIKTYDLFIELNGSHYHHFHPFNENDNKDIMELNILKSKVSKTQKKNQYDNIIYTWTILDPAKRKIAKDNNLRFLELWTNDDKENINKIKKYLNISPAH